jgi:hypothetical protein
MRRMGTTTSSRGEEEREGGDGCLGFTCMYLAENACSRLCFLCSPGASRFPTLCHPLIVSSTTSGRLLLLGPTPQHCLVLRILKSYALIIILSSVNCFYAVIPTSMPHLMRLEKNNKDQIFAIREIKGLS